MTIDGRCKLCRKERELRDSHIIPKFFYKDMKLDDKSHRYWILSGTEKRPLKSKTPKCQGGICEYLLCGCCEELIGQFETYASRLISGGILVEHRRIDERLTLISGIDYIKFKLFQLSILWRAHISSDRMFERVRLGSHESVIRNMILSRNPGPSNLYSCIIVRILNQKEIMDDFIEDAEMLPCSIFDRKAYRFTFGGFSWIYFVDHRGCPEEWRPYVINEGGNMVMADMQITEMEYLRRFASDLKRQGKLPIK